MQTSRPSVVSKVMCVLMLSSLALHAAERPPIRPTDQELRSASFWLEHALLAADRIDDPRDKSRNLCNIGVAAFNIARFDIARQIMMRPDLELSDHDTIAYRFERAFEDAKDLARLVELAEAMRHGHRKTSCIEVAAVFAREMGERAVIDKLLKQVQDSDAHEEIIESLKRKADAAVRPAEPAVPLREPDAIQLAELGRFLDGVELAKADKRPSDRAYAMASIATLMARSPNRDEKACRELIAEAEKAIETAIVAERNEPPDEVFPISPETVGDQLTREVVRAYAALSDLQGTRAALGRITGVPFRRTALWYALSDQSERGDTQFTESLLKAESKWLGPVEAVDFLLFVVASHVKNGKFKDAESVAAQMKGAESALAMLNVAKGLEAAKQTDESRRVLARAESIADPLALWPRTPLPDVMQYRASLLDCRSIWGKAVAHKDPQMRVALMVAAARGLFERLTGEQMR